MYAQVVVLTYQAPDSQTFTYEIPKESEKEIKIGQLVSVPFGKRNPYGVILELQDKISVPSEKIRKITSIVLKKSLLLPYQIELIKWMSNYYQASMLNCTKAMLPEIPKDLITNISALPSSSQTLVLVPSINQLPQTMAKYNSKNFALFHGELKPREKFGTWQKIASGNFDYIFGTRSAIFAPCPNLKEIIIYDEHDSAYKDERSPYFDTLTVAQKIAQLTGAELSVFDTAPKITTYSLGVIQIPKQETVKTQIVSMLDEKSKGNKTAISDILETYIKLGTQKNKKILLFLNKKKESGHIYCKNCKYSEFAPKQPEICPNCNSADIYFNSTNINTLFSMAKKLALHTNINIIAAKSKTIDADSDIDIATASVFYKLHLRKYDLVAHIQTDSLLNNPDYTSGEKLYQQIQNLKKITRGLLLLQTYSPQNSTIANAAEGNFPAFAKEEIEQRKSLSYPPYSALVKIIIKGKDEEKTEEKANALYEKLNDLASRNVLSDTPPRTYLPTILGPNKPSFFSKTPKYNIILKVPTKDYSLESREKAIEKIRTLLEISKDFQIVVEPNQLND